MVLGLTASLEKPMVHPKPAELGSELLARCPSDWYAHERFSSTALQWSGRLWACPGALRANSYYKVRTTVPTDFLH